MPYDRYLELGGNLGAFTDPTLMLSTTLSDDSSLPMMVVDPITRTARPGPRYGTPIERAVRMMADASALRYQLDPDRRSMILTTPDIGIPDPAVLRELSVLAAQHPDFKFEALGQIPDLTNSLFLDGAPGRPSNSIRGRASTSVTASSSPRPSGSARPTSGRCCPTTTLDPGMERRPPDGVCRPG